MLCKKKPEVAPIVETKSNAQECLNKLCFEILGENYYIASPVGGNQANEIVTEDIIRYCKKKKGRC
jgi:hypothetical protein